MNIRRRDGSGIDKRLVLRLVCGIVLMGAILLTAYIVGRRIEGAGGAGQVRGDLTDRLSEPEIIEYGGRQYTRKSKQVSILLQGIDRMAEGTEKPTGARNGGQADLLLVLLLDHEAKSASALQIDRDTMAEIVTLGILGNVTGTRTAQICLSHGFGDGGGQSAQYTVDAVSNLLLGVPIDYYFALNMDGISTLNDALGGVTVTLEDDFSRLDPSMTAGTTLTLMGMQAEYYTRQRKNIGIGTSASRMVRQQVYMNQMSSLMREKVNNDSNFIGELFDELNPYLLTNMKRGRLINEAWKARAYPFGEIDQLAGTHTDGADGFVEFHADETALIDTVLELFYREI